VLETVISRTLRFVPADRVASALYRIHERERVVDFFRCSVQMMLKPTNHSNILNGRVDKLWSGFFNLTRPTNTSDEALLRLFAKCSRVNSQLLFTKLGTNGLACVDTVVPACFETRYGGRPPDVRRAVSIGLVGACCELGFRVVFGIVLVKINMVFS
jgi:hypothetical protein